jgi:hypothetical protein
LTPGKGHFDDPSKLPLNEFPGQRKPAMTDMLWHRGGCHCKAVRFEVLAPAHLVVDECNCSICSRTGYLHPIVPRDRFRLVSGEPSSRRTRSTPARHDTCSAGDAASSRSTCRVRT